MPRNTTVLRVFVASPSDVSDERDAVNEVINELNLTLGRNTGILLEAVKWETNAIPGIGADAQAVVNDAIGDDYDILVGIMWTRYGTPTSRAGSGTEEELERALTRFREHPKELRIMFYFKDAPISPSSLDTTQLAKIQAFREELGKQGGLYWSFNSTDDFRNFLRIHLSKQVHDFGKTWGAISPPAEASPFPSEPSGLADDGSDDEVGLLDLMETAEDSSGRLIEALHRVEEATRSIGERMAERTDEIEKLNVGPGTFSAKNAKRVSNRAADDMTSYAEALDVEVPKVAAALEGVIQPLSSIITQRDAFGPVDLGDRSQLRASIDAAIDSIETTTKQIAQFRDVVASLPRMTTALNHAKRKVVNSLDRFVTQMASGVSLLTEVRKALDDFPGRDADD